jgi:DnaJ-class molecular chaperone
MKDYYKILEVEEKASADEIKKSYRSLSKKYHPDVNPEGGEQLPAADAAPEGGEEADPKKEFQEAVGKIGQTINDLQDKDQFDAKDIKNAMNSLISAIGPEGFKEVGDKAIESFYKKMQGSQESSSEEAPAEEAPVEEVPTEEPSTEKLDENFIKGLKTKAKVLLKEQLQQEIEKRKRNLLIQNIKRKLI